MPRHSAPLSRRKFAAGALGAAAAWAAGSAHAQRKLTKKEAEYQETPKGILMCATCSLFVRPSSCKVMEGDVIPEGWCNAFDLAD